MARRAPARGEQPDETTPADTAAEEQGAAGAEGQSDEQVEDLAEDLVAKYLPERVSTALRLKPAFAPLLAEACYVFGINPDPALKPRELAAYRGDSGEPDGTPPVPASVILVTAGGLKIRYPVDEDTEHRLRIVYNAFKVDKATGEKRALPLPEDLTLPRENVDGQVRTQEHVYKGGYLREGGKAEQQRRAKLKELRAKGNLGNA